MNKCNLTPNEEAMLQAIINANGLSPNAHNSIGKIVRYAPTEFKNLKLAKKIIKKLISRGFVFKHPTGADETYNFDKSVLECFDDIP